MFPTFLLLVFAMLLSLQVSISLPYQLGSSLINPVKSFLLRRHFPVDLDTLILIRVLLSPACRLTPLTLCIHFKACCICSGLVFVPGLAGSLSEGWGSDFPVDGGNLLYSLLFHSFVSALSCPVTVGYVTVCPHLKTDFSCVFTFLIFCTS